MCSFKESLLGILLMDAFATQGNPDVGDAETHIDMQDRIFPVPAWVPNWWDISCSLVNGKVFYQNFIEKVHSQS